MKLVQWTPGNTRRNTLFGDFDREFENLMSWALTAPSVTETKDQNGGVTRRLTPPMDLVQEKDHYKVHLDLPGLRKDDIEVTFQDGVLTIRGERKSEQKEEKDGKVVRQERYVGTFERTLRLPEKIDAPKVTARFEDGVLELTLPFLPEAQPVRLQIQ
ncbi:MAG: Hsp20/alpha crystallin family protein [Candidatus Eisenbacteria bacterium]